MKVLKRIICMWMMSTLLFCAAAVSAVAAGSYIRGDADGDGEVTVLDATVIQRKLAEMPVFSFHESAADVDGDGLDVTDAAKIQRCLAAFNDPYGIGEAVFERPSEDEYELPFIPIG